MARYTASTHGNEVTEEREKSEEGREKREERREAMAAILIHYIFTLSRDHFEKVMEISRGQRNGRQLDSLQL